jgi:hypothetical protein
MADLQQDDEQAPESRTAHFSAGASGSGMGSTIASALPQVKQASPDFDPASSVLLASNQYSGLGNASSDSTLKIANPYGLSMRNSIRQGNMGTSQ